jgi:hypothetical protein
MRDRARFASRGQTRGDSKRLERYTPLHRRPLFQIARAGKVSILAIGSSSDPDEAAKIESFALTIPLPAQRSQVPMWRIS